MKHEKLSQALNEVRDQYIEEATKKKLPRPISRNRIEVWVVSLYH